MIKSGKERSTLCVVDLQDPSSVTYGPNCCGYAWLDDDRILYAYMSCSSLNILDLNTGTRHRFIKNLGQVARAGLECHDSRLQSLIQSDSAAADGWRYGPIRCVEGRIYFAAARAGFAGLFSIDKDKSNLELVYSHPKRWLMYGLDVDALGNAVMLYNHGCLRGGNTREAVGVYREFLDAGWNILRMGSTAQLIM